MTTQITQALRDALAAYLAAYLAADWPDLAVGKWPTPGKALPPQALSVLAPGPPETVYHPASIVSTTPTTGVNGTVIYTYGTVTLGLQIDAWAAFEAKRDALALAVEGALNRPPAETLGTSDLPRLRRRGGLVLPVTSLLGLRVDYRFEALPLPVENSDAAQSGEWRATWTGTAFAYLADQQQVALLKQLTLDLTVNGATDTRTVE